MQKVKEGVYRGLFEELYPVLREHGAEPEALETFWSELGDIPVNDDDLVTNMIKPYNDGWREDKRYSTVELEES